MFRRYVKRWSVKLVFWRDCDEVSLLSGQERGLNARCVCVCSGEESDKWNVNEIEQSYINTKEDTNPGVESIIGIYVDLESIVQNTDSNLPSLTLLQHLSLIYVLNKSEVY